MQHSFRAGTIALVCLLGSCLQGCWTQKEVVTCRNVREVWCKHAATVADVVPAPVNGLELCEPPSPEEDVVTKLCSDECATRVQSETGKEVQNKGEHLQWCVGEELVKKGQFRFGTNFCPQIVTRLCLAWELTSKVRECQEDWTANRAGKSNPLVKKCAAECAQSGNNGFFDHTCVAASFGGLAPDPESEADTITRVLQDLAAFQLSGRDPEPAERAHPAKKAHQAAPKSARADGEASLAEGVAWHSLLSTQLEADRQEEVGIGHERPLHADGWPVYVPEPVLDLLAPPASLVEVDAGARPREVGHAPSEVLYDPPSDASSAMQANESNATEERAQPAERGAPFERTAGALATDAAIDAALQ